MLAPSAVIIILKWNVQRLAHRLEIRTGKFLCLDLNSRKYVTP